MNSAQFGSHASERHLLAIDITRLPEAATSLQQKLSIWEGICGLPKLRPAAQILCRFSDPRCKLTNGNADRDPLRR